MTACLTSTRPLAYATAILVAMEGIALWSLLLSAGTYVHTYIHTHMCMYIRTVHSYTHVYVHTYVHSYTHVHVYTYKTYKGLSVEIVQILRNVCMLVCAVVFSFLKLLDW